MTEKCINLRERFGKQYKVTYEPSYHAEHGASARVEDAWLMIVVCKFGHIFPHGGTTLAGQDDQGVASEQRTLFDD